MSNKSIINYLLLHEQSAIRDLLIQMGIFDVDKRIKKLLDYELFEILDCNKIDITKIKKKSTGEIFKIGIKFYHPEYNLWHEVWEFDNFLTGTFAGNNYYKNYIRADDGGIYHLNEISLKVCKKEDLMIQEKTEIIL